MQLILNTFGTSVRRKGDRFVIKRKESDRRVEFSAHKVQSIVIATGMHLSSNVIHLTSEHNVDVVLLDKSRHPTARVWQTKMGSTAAIRRRQLEVAETDEAMVFVREWTTSKINNQLEFLRELARRRPDADDIFAVPLGTLQDCLAKVAACSGTVDEQRGTLMGLEGAAGRGYFACLGRLMPAEYRESTLDADRYRTDELLCDQVWSPKETLRSTGAPQSWADIPSPHETPGRAY